MKHRMPLWAAWLAGLGVACGGGQGSHSRGPASAGGAPSGLAEGGGDAVGERAFMRLHFIDVGQGDATLLEFRCGAVLIDTGGERQPADHRGSHCPAEGTPVGSDEAARDPNVSYDSTERLLAYLDAFFERRADLQRTLDAVYLTHPHVDHTRGAPALMRRYRVRGLVTNGQTEGSGSCEQNAARALAEGDAGVALREVQNPRQPFGITDSVLDPVACADTDPELRVLFGRTEAAGASPDWSRTDLRNENEHSVVVRVGFGAFSALFTGDLQHQGIADLLAQSAPEVLDVDLYQVGHHGSHNATTQPLLQAMSPAIAVISMGPMDRHGEYSAYTHGHPRRDIVELLAAHTSGRREPAAEVQVATGQRAFEAMPMSAAVYATGWQGHVVVRAFADGEFIVEP